MAALLGEFQWKDKKGRIWDCSLDLGVAYRIEKSDFSELTDRKIDLVAFDREDYLFLSTNTKVLMAVIWAIVSPQSKDLTGFDVNADHDKAEDEFISSLSGPAIQSAKTAFWRAVADFFPERKTALLTMLKQQEDIQTKLNQQIESLEPEIKATLDQELDNEIVNLRRELKQLGEKSTSASESSASVPASGSS